MTNNIIPFKEPDPKCSFCGTPKSACQHFFSGAEGKYICGVCVTHAKQRLQSKDQTNDDSTQ